MAPDVSDTPPPPRPRYAVTKRIEFCYGHRLIDHDGPCRHLHGHNGVVEVEVAAASLDERDMVCDFAEIARVVKGWLDRELDHRMILRRDDPLVAPLSAAGEPVYLVDDNPTAECLARLVYEQMHRGGLQVSRVTLWETPSSSATYTRPGD